MCCDSWGRKQSDTTKQLNCIELRVKFKRAIGRPFLGTCNSSPNGLKPRLISYRLENLYPEWKRIIISDTLNCFCK